MEHEILFRGKRKDNGEWIDSLTLFQLDKNLYMLQTAWADITYDLQYNITAILGRKKPFLVEVIPSTVGQYTGLTDKNGVKIFEGDVLEAENGNRGHVVFRNGAFMKLCNSEDMPFLIASDVNTVIGNVFDNPELLKGK